MPRRLTATLAASALALLCLLSAPARAVDVEGLYQGAVEVQSRNDERERQRALGPALRQVLLKVTGRQDSLEHPVIAAALSRAENYAASWAYRSRLVPPAAGEEGAPRERIELEVSFFEGAVQDLLKSAEIPLWPQNRPVTLVWAVVQEELGERELLSSSSEHALAEALEAEARQRGLPLAFPLLDLEDRRALSADQVWAFDQEAILAASQRYQAPSVLVLRVYRALGGEQVASLFYLFRERGISEELYESELRALAVRPLTLVASELAGYYGLQLTPSSTALPVRMLVEGIDAPEDYAGLLRYLDGLADVSQVSVSEVSAQGIALELQTGGQIPQLVETIALNRSLQATADLLRDGEAIVLRYRWIDR